MPAETIDSPIEFFQKLGGLHDVEVDQIELDVEKEVLTLGVEDLNANFGDLPEYPGRRPCRLLFQEVEAVTMDVTLAEGFITISAAELREDISTLRLEMDLRSGGRVSGGKNIIITFKSLQIIDN